MTALTIAEAYIFQYPKFFDERGFFSTVYQNEPGDTGQYQVNCSFSHRNVFRGFHYSVGVPESKRIFVPKGRIIDFIIDIRPESPTAGVVCAIILDSENTDAVYVPAGCAHGFYAVEDSIVTYVASRHWNPADERGFNVDSLVCRETIKNAINAIRKSQWLSDIPKDARLSEIFNMSKKDRELPPWLEI